MPRALPWLTGASSSSTKDAPRKAKSEKPPPSRKRSSSPADLLNSDLEPLQDTPSPTRKPKKHIHREPSSSPPPVKVAPLVEYMKAGFTMDDRYMMVEDEFYSTATMFSLPLHQDEYERTRRRAKARGAETLKLIVHGTDGTTDQSRALRLKLEAEERAKKMKVAAGVNDGASSDDDDEIDEFMADSQLAGLMTASQSTPRKSLRGFATGSHRTPRMAGGRTRDVLEKERVYIRPNISSIEEDDEGMEDETEDEDDLDAFLPKARSTPAPISKHASTFLEKSSSMKPGKNTGFFKQFTKPMQIEREERQGASEKTTTASSSRGTPLEDSSTPPVPRKLSPTRNTPRDTTPASSRPKPFKMSRAAAILARRREAEREGRHEPASLDQQIKQELQSQAHVKEEPSTQTQGRTQIKREPSPSPVRRPTTSKSMAQRRAERGKREAEDKKKSSIDDIPIFLF